MHKHPKQNFRRVLNLESEAIGRRCKFQWPAIQKLTLRQERARVCRQSWLFNNRHVGTLSELLNFHAEVCGSLCAYEHRGILVEANRCGCRILASEHGKRECGALFSKLNKIE